ncbi:MAG: abortive infection family protein [Propionicimonas sp.]|uniref:abortive infection family protein n=1 Tax=Propionicimonas sp. TaxID=1955623 RepID=UPI003D0C3499
MADPASQDIAAALASYFFGGSGPSHSKLTTIFMSARLGDVAPNAGGSMTDGPNKEARVQRTVMAAVRHPEAARPLVDGLLSALRTSGAFDRDSPGYDGGKLRTLRRAFDRQGWLLSDDGDLSPIGEINVSTGGRSALEEQLSRLRQNTSDAGALLGTAKDMLEATAKLILQELDVEYTEKMSFDELWHHARERLGILPQQVAQDVPGAASIKTIVQSAWTIAHQVNVLRGLQGSGHGRALPTGVSATQALFVVREACSMAEFALATLDWQMGRT